MYVAGGGGFRAVLCHLLCLHDVATCPRPQEPPVPLHGGPVCLRGPRVPSQTVPVLRFSVRHSGTPVTSSFSYY